MKHFSLTLNILLIPLCITLVICWEGEHILRMRYEEKFVKAVKVATYYQGKFDRVRVICEPMLIQRLAYQMHMDQVQKKKDSLRWLARRIEEGGVDELRYVADTIRFFPRSKEYLERLSKK